MPISNCGMFLHVYMKRLCMKQVILFHNPGAGDEDHSKEELMPLMKEHGFDCRYLSTKEKDWKDFRENADLLVIAGGDGTVRKVIKELLKRKDNPPIALLPLGTANNIASTFGITGSSEEIISSWKNGVIKKIDTGKLENIAEEDFFIEGVGFGIFPYLMQQGVQEGQADTAEESLKRALRSLLKILGTYEPLDCKLAVDDTDHSGKFLLVEIMNTKAIGPGMLLSPAGDPGDGELEVILIPEAHKEKFESYLLDKIEGREPTYHFHTLKAKSVSIKCKDKNIHVDDKLIKIEESVKVKIAINEGILNFLVPPQPPS